jgi:putative resolvase
LEKQGRRTEVVNLAENGQEDLMSDLASIIYSVSARLYGHRLAKRNTEKVMEELTNDESEGSLDATGGTTSDRSPRSAMEGH